MTFWLFSPAGHASGTFLLQDYFVMKGETHKYGGFRQNPTSCLFEAKLSMHQCWHTSSFTPWFAPASLYPHLLCRLLQGLSHSSSPSWLAPTGILWFHLICAPFSAFPGVVSKDNGYLGECFKVLNLLKLSRLAKE